MPFAEVVVEGAEVVVVKAVRAAVGIIAVRGSRGCGEGGDGQLHRRSQWGWVIQGLVVVVVDAQWPLLLSLVVVAALSTQIAARW